MLAGLRTWMTALGQKEPSTLVTRCDGFTPESGPAGGGL
jgi:hypothetical protein